MIIDTEGNILQAVYSTEAKIVMYGGYSIALFYDEQTRQNLVEINKLKNNLTKTDYKAIKFAEGEISEEDFEPTRQDRKAWREKIRELEKQIVIPTITEIEMENARQKALEKLKG